VSQNDPIPTKERIKEEVRSQLGEGEMLEEFVEFTEEYKQGNVSVSSGSLGATKAKLNELQQRHGEMSKYENAWKGAYQAGLDELNNELQSPKAGSDSPLQVDEDLYDHKKPNAERESLLRPGTIQNDKYGEYGYGAGKGIDVYERAAKEDPDLVHFQVDKDTEDYGHPRQRTQMEITAARSLLTHKEPAYKQAMKENDDMMTSLNELNFQTEQQNSQIMQARGKGGPGFVIEKNPRKPEVSFTDLKKEKQYELMRKDVGYARGAVPLLPCAELSVYSVPVPRAHSGRLPSFSSVLT
jgi:hypothetical protein